MASARGTAGAMVLGAVLTVAAGHGAAWFWTMVVMVPAGMVLALIFMRLMP